MSKITTLYNRRSDPMHVYRAYHRCDMGNQNQLAGKNDSDLVEFFVVLDSDGIPSGVDFLSAAMCGACGKEARRRFSWSKLIVTGG